MHPSTTAELHLHATPDHVLSTLGGGFAARGVTVTLDGDEREVPWTRTLPARRVTGRWQLGRRAGRATLDLVPAASGAWTLVSLTLEGRGTGRRPDLDDAASVLRSLRSTVEARETSVPPAGEVVRLHHPVGLRPTAAVGYSRP